MQLYGYTKHVLYFSSYNQNICIKAGTKTDCLFIYFIFYLYLLSLLTYFFPSGQLSFNKTTVGEGYNAPAITPDAFKDKAFESPSET